MKVLIIYIYIVGVQVYDKFTNSNFTLHAHVLLWTGDIPAISKLVNLTGHNSYMGCRFCNLRGVYSQHIYYPLQYEDSTIIYDPYNLPNRNHEEYLEDIEEIENLTGTAKSIHIMERGNSLHVILFKIT